MSEAKYTLVTGAAGFIGSALIHALNQSGLTDIVAKRYLSQDEKFKNLIPLRYADYIEADDLIELAEEEPDYFDQFETIFHSWRLLCDDRERCQLSNSKQLRIHQNAGCHRNKKRHPLRLRIKCRNLWRRKQGHG